MFRNMVTKKSLLFVATILFSSMILATPALAQVTQAWVTRYDGPAHGDDSATAIALDADGNIYVTGSSWGGIASDLDYVTVKYNASGVQLWASRYNGPGNSVDFATAIAVDFDGNVYVTGSSWGTTSSLDYATLKYSTQGEQIWVTRYNGPGNGVDIATSIALDDDGNVYVTGYSTGVSSGFDYATIKYDPDGNQLWEARYNGPGNGDDLARAIAVDDVGNVYVTGESLGDGTKEDYATIKYDADGSQLWEARYNGPGNDVDRATALALDGLGNVFVTGESMGVGTKEDYATLAYDPDGNQVWEARYNGPGNGVDRAIALILDDSGNIYVTGESDGDDTGSDYATLAYDPDGNQLWVARYTGTETGNDFAKAIAIDRQGNIYVTGESKGADTSWDYATVKYGPAGNQIWAVRFDGVESLDDKAKAIAVNAQGNVYVTGRSWGGLDANFDFATIKYTQ